MDNALDHLRGLDDTQRLLFRSRHIYLLFAALLNVALGTYFEIAPHGWRRWVQFVASTAILVAPPLLVVAFLVEPSLSGLDGPYSKLAIYGCFGAVLLHAISRLRAARTGE
jgi:hypothetical protein